MVINIRGLDFNWTLNSLNLNIFEEVISSDTWVDILMEINAQGLVHSQKIQMQAGEFKDLVTNLRCSAFNLKQFSFSNLESNFKVDIKINATGVILINFEISFVSSQNSGSKYTIYFKGETDPYSLENCLLY
jgi:hypothetical protein